jgi:atypical dual specificity phosphatase
MMPQVFNWVLPDKLGACVNPFVSQSAVTALHTNGITMLVNLHERPDPQDVLEQLQAQTVHLPVSDSNAPTQAQIDEGVAAIEKALQEGKRVAVHCGAGLGRSGTLIAAYLVSQGQAPEQAMAQVRTARPGSIETLEQEAAVHEYARRLNAS